MNALGNNPEFNDMFKQVRESQLLISKAMQSFTIPSAAILAISSMQEQSRAISEMINESFEPVRNMLRTIEFHQLKFESLILSDTFEKLRVIPEWNLLISRPHELEEQSEEEIEQFILNFGNVFENGDPVESEDEVVITPELIQQIKLNSLSLIFYLTYFYTLISSAELRESVEQWIMFFSQLARDLQSAFGNKN